jgi:hypothetical protein
MPAGRPKKVRDDAPLLSFRVTPEVLVEVEEYARDLEKRTPGMIFTKQDAVRAILGAWATRRIKDRELR